MRRILAATLYFIEVRTSEAVLHKIGVTTRSLEQRLAEIRVDLMPHFGEVELKALGTWAHRGNVEPYFKFRYRKFQRPIGTLTEYFAFDDVKGVLRDLRRMQPKESDDLERGILAGEPSSAEARTLRPDEILSPEAWLTLCSLTRENLDCHPGTWHELHNFRWEGEHRALIQPTPGTIGYQPRRSAFGEAYWAAFAAFYAQRYYDTATST
jgi:hypothetical protein